MVLNSKKLELRRERVTFFGAEYSAQGMHPDPKKVQGITEMTVPKDKQQLQSFLGMVNYMGTFIPNLSHHTEPLQAMLKKDNTFHWEDQQTRSFQQVKTLIAKANTTPLRYYDRNLPVTVQVDASLRGLGACLIQQNKGKDQLIAFASKSLTDAETRYANIERELLAIVFACQRFSTYLLGRSFVAETNHKPLEMERSFNSLLAGTRDRQGHPVTRSQMDNLRDQQQRIAVLKQVASQPQNQPRPVSAPPAANVPLPPYPRRCPSDKGSKKQVQAENANALRKSSDSETDRLQDIQEEPRRHIGPSRVKELAKFFTPTSDEEENSRVNNRTRRKKLFEPKKEEENEK